MPLDRSNGMTITIIAVHPSVVMIEADGRRMEFSPTWFSTTPKVGQAWTLSLDHVPTEGEQRDHLNKYLAREQ